VMGLSGRQVAHGKGHTPEALAAGMWVLLAVAALLEQIPASRLRQLAAFVLNGSIPTDAQQDPLRDTG